MRITKDNGRETERERDRHWLQERTAKIFKVAANEDWKKQVSESVNQGGAFAKEMFFFHSFTTLHICPFTFPSSSNIPTISTYPTYTHNYIGMKKADSDNVLYNACYF